MFEVEELGVQAIASIAGEAGEMFQRLAAWAVERIGDERVELLLDELKRKHDRMLEAG